MGSSPAPTLISVVVTVKNERRHVAQLLDSLLVQEGPFEVVVVDALSHDGTWEILTRYAATHPDRIRVAQKYGSRGIGRNAAVDLAKGDCVAFIDGDCIADSRWLAELRVGLQEAPVAAGTTKALGSAAYGVLERVELFERGNDVTYPSCNLGYRRNLFQSLRGFDPRFITAEDIDLNLRAVERGATIRFVPNAVVYHQMRSTFVRFLFQAYWNGYGRKQLTEKHGALWGHYRVRRLMSNQKSVISWIRLVAALVGYFSRVLTGFGVRLTAAAESDTTREPDAASGPTDGAARRA
ncbi:MAG: glycosyltransferase [Thermoplasmata archaeon]|nr:glycosyltransferase [Thermoplasmata archaeon]